MVLAGVFVYVQFELSGYVLMSALTNAASFVTCESTE